MSHTQGSLLGKDAKVIEAQLGYNIHSTIATLQKREVNRITVNETYNNTNIPIQNTLYIQNCSICCHNNKLYTLIWHSLKIQIHVINCHKN